jgi:hypothetical protein
VQIVLWKLFDLGKFAPLSQERSNKMHHQKNSTTTNPAPPDAASPKQRYRFDTLDWIAACFVIVAWLYIVYQLFYR